MTIAKSACAATEHAPIALTIALATGLADPHGVARPPALKRRSTRPRNPTVASVAQQYYRASSRRQAMLP
jgi:hypothetical protein